MIEELGFTQQSPLFLTILPLKKVVNNFLRNECLPIKYQSLRSILVSNDKSIHWYRKGEVPTLTVRMDERATRKEHGRIATLG